MEPASMYLAVVCGVFGVWLAGERIWALGTAVVTYSPSGRYRTRIVTSLIAVMMALTLMRVGSVGAATLPMRERVVLESEKSAPSAPEPLLSRFGSLAASRTPRTGASGSSYTVESGECLWRIARSILETEEAAPSGAQIADFWQSVYNLNREIIGDNPNLIHPGQVLRIPER